MFKKFHGERSRTSQSGWQNVAPWYNRITEQGKGHYYHQHVVIPSVLRLLDSSLRSPNPSILDLACGNGVLAKNLPKQVKYTGIDLSDKLIKYAKYADKNYSHKYLVADVSRPLNLTEKFDAVTIILALQNIKNVEGVLANAAKYLDNDGKLIIVLNHPIFRIPRQSSWGIDEARKIQYRRIDKYMSSMEIPILTNPSNPSSPSTLSYHHPLSYYVNALSNLGFLIQNIEEWTSDKESQVGRTGKMENRSRNEFPLFMTIVATKK